MPFWKKDSGKPKEKTNYKARLEHKQYLVRIFSDVFLLISGLNISYIFSSISLIQQYVSWPYSSSPRGGISRQNKNFSFQVLAESIGISKGFFFLFYLAVSFWFVPAPL